MRKTRHRGVAADFLLNLIAYNLIRIPKLLAVSPPATGSTQRQVRKQTASSWRPRSAA